MKYERRKKLLYLIGSKDPGGAERIVLDLARNFRLKGYDVAVGHLGNVWLSDQLKAHNIHDICFEFAKFYSSHKTEWYFVWNLLKFIKTHGFDLIHSHLFGMILYSSIAGKLLNIPVIGTVHDKYYFMEKEYRRLAYKLTQMLGCTIVTVSEDIKNNLSLRWRIKGDDIITIYNGTDLSVFDRRFDENGKRKRLGLGKDDIVVISVGRLVKIKGHASMLKAVKNIIEQNEKVKFLIVGDGPERANIEEIVKSEGIDRHIILTGHREDINELLKVSDIFVQTSLSEGLSCTIMEAIASGLPVVGTDVGGNKELLTHGREGYLVPVGDRRAFEEKVIALANDRNLRARLARNARQKAERKFPLETMVGKYENLYQGLLS